MSDIDPKKLKVAELRDELKARGLDTKGNKAQLVKRLEKAIAKDNGEAGDADSSINESMQEGDASVNEEGDTSAVEADEPEGQAKGRPDPTFDIEDSPPVEAEAPEDMQEESAEAEAAEGQEEASEQPEGQEEATKKKTTPKKTTPKKAEAKKAEEKESAENGDEQPEFQVVDAVDDSEAPEADQKQEERRGEKRRHRDSDRGGRRDRSPREEKKQKIEEENEDWLKVTTFQLDRYNADLNIRVSDDGLKANPITVEGFAFMWAGVRSMFGVKKGKVGFEVKVLDHLHVDHLPQEEITKHIVRVGLSTDTCSLQLGEEKMSFAFGGTGKSCTDNKFDDFAETFTEGDVIGCWVDFDSSPATIAYTKNGKDLGTCFEFDASELAEGQALFPHVLTKNCEFEINFGEKETPYFPARDGYVFIHNVAEEDRIRGSLPPVKREDCEIIMMCGLPACGKTTWVNKHVAANPEKRFTVLGTNNLIERMKVMGQSRRRNYAGRWDYVIDKSNKCLHRLMEIAAKKKRNYILDQTNVYPSAQRRKMRPFEGFQRKAVVIVPSDEEFKKRCEERGKEDNKEVNEQAIIEMKAHFTLPDDSEDCFDTVEFLEGLEKEEAVKLVEQYNKDGKAALPPPEKRWRHGGDRDRWGGRDNRDNRRGGYDRDRGYGRDRRGGGGNRYGDRYEGGRDRNRSGGGGGGYMGYSSSDRRRASEYKGGDRRYDNRSGGRSGGYSGGGRSYNQGGSWGNQGGSWGNKGNWNNQGGSWGSQGSWGNQGSGGWGNQQWGGYNNTSGQNWSNQGYGSNYSNYGNYNQGYGNQSQDWSGYYNQSSYHR